jgi:hypothetical protein
MVAWPWRISFGWLDDNVDTLDGDSPIAFILEVCIQGENGVRQIEHEQAMMNIKGLKTP